MLFALCIQMVFLCSGNLSFLNADLQGCSGRSLTVPCAMAAMFLPLLKIARLMHPSIMPFLLRRSIMLLLHIHPSVQ